MLFVHLYSSFSLGNCFLYFESGPLIFVCQESQRFKLVDLLFYGLVNLLRSCQARSTYRAVVNKYRVPIISQAILCERYVAGPEDRIRDRLNTCRTAHSIYLAGPANWRSRGLFEQVYGNTKRWETILDKNYLSYLRKKRPHG